MPKSVFPLLLLLALAAAACAPSPVAPPVEAPVQPLVIGTSKTPQVALPPDEPMAHDAPVATSTPLVAAARDPRLARPTRARGLVVAELQTLEQLFAATPHAAPDRPIIARRLAENYSELARGSGGAGSGPARQGALKYYELIASEYPKEPRIDEAYYYAGLEHEMSGNSKDARKAYYTLIQHVPSSKLVPLAYFAFGEMFFVEAKADPSKLDLAEQAFKEVLKYPPPGNAVHAEAQSRLEQIAAARRP